ncbi:MAG: benenodin family lasso peptide [Sphingomonas sp.]
MDREANEVVDLIDLGAASVETQGEGTRISDFVALQDPLGLSDD